LRADLPSTGAYTAGRNEWVDKNIMKFKRYKSKDLSLGRKRLSIKTEQELTVWEAALPRRTWEL